MSDAGASAKQSDATEVYETEDAGTPIERAGRKGHLFANGSILWADGEKEVPVSGIPDETKRAMARQAAEGYALEPARPGVSDAELAGLEEQGRLAGTPPTLSERRDAAKEAAKRKPGATKPVPSTPDQVQNEYRRSAKVLIEREIERLEELKAMAIAGAVELAFRGLPVPHRNPPMALHDAILAAIRIADGGNPVAMTQTLRDMRDWTTQAAAAQHRAATKV